MSKHPKAPTQTPQQLVDQQVQYMIENGTDERGYIARYANDGQHSEEEAAAIFQADFAKLRELWEKVK